MKPTQDEEFPELRLSQSPVRSAHADEARSWVASPAAAHEQWRRPDGELSAHTIAQYKSQFGRFCEWLTGRRLRIDVVQKGHIDQFLQELTGRDSKPATPKTRRAYLGEIDRVMQHLVALGLRQDNPAADVTRNPWQGRIGSYTVVVPDVDVPRLDRMFGRLIAQPALHETSSGAGAAASRARSAEGDALRLALAGLMLHGGMTPKEIQQLRVRDLRGLTDSSGFIDVVFSGDSRAERRTVRLKGWSVLALERWCARLAARYRVRLADQSDASVLAFPSPRRERDGAVSARPMTPKAMWANINALFKRVGLKGFVGPQSLRTLYIANLIAQGLPDEAVRAQAGLKRLEQVDAVRKALGIRRSASGLK